jgi:hypothetical protein
MDLAVLGEDGVGFGVVVDAGVEALAVVCRFGEADGDVDAMLAGSGEKRGGVGCCDDVAVLEPGGEVVGVGY